MTCEDEVQLLYGRRDLVVEIINRRMEAMVHLWDFISNMAGEACNERVEAAGVDPRIKCCFGWGDIERDIRAWWPELKSQIDSVAVSITPAIDDVRCQDDGWEERLELAKNKINNLLSLAGNVLSGIFHYSGQLCLKRTEQCMGFPVAVPTPPGG